MTYNKLYMIWFRSYIHQLMNIRDIILAQCSCCRSCLGSARTALAGCKYPKARPNPNAVAVADARGIWCIWHPPACCVSLCPPPCHVAHCTQPIRCNVRLMPNNMCKSVWRPPPPSADPFDFGHLGAEKFPWPTAPFDDARVSPSLSLFRFLISQSFSECSTWCPEWVRFVTHLESVLEPCPFRLFRLLNNLKLMAKGMYLVCATRKICIFLSLSRGGC